MEHDGRPKSVLLKRPPPPGVKRPKTRKPGKTELEKAHDEQQLVLVQSQLENAKRQVESLTRMSARLAKKAGR